MLASNESFEVLARRFDPEDWMPRSLALDLNLQHEDLVREYEFRSAYHLTSQEETRRQLDANRAFSRYLLLRTAARKGAVEFRRVDQAQGGPAARVQRAYRGAVGTARRPVEFAAGPPEMRYGSSLNLLEQNAKIWADSPLLISGAIEYQGVRPNLPLILRRELEVFAQNERWSFQLWRPVPLLHDAEARASYGTTTETFAFSLSQSITSRLRVAYELTVSPPESRPTESVIKLLYGARI
jgi:hypothetical protein